MSKGEYDPEQERWDKYEKEERARRGPRPRPTRVSFVMPGEAAAIIRGRAAISGKTEEQELLLVLRCGIALEAFRRELVEQVHRFAALRHQQELERREWALELLDSFTLAAATAGGFIDRKQVDALAAVLRLQWGGDRDDRNKKK